MDKAILDQEKKLAALRSLEYVKSDMIVGLGTGSTSAHMIRGLGEKIRNGLSIKAVASSERSAQLAVNLGIELISLDRAGMLDIYIDGADEFDEQFRLIKGGGGALLREKILAYNSRFNVIIADSSKRVNKLGKFKLPVEVIGFAGENVYRKLSELNLDPLLRMEEGKAYQTDEGNLIYDIDIFKLENIDKFNQNLINIPGVVETGLFLNLVDVIIYASNDECTVLENKDLHP